MPTKPNINPQNGVAYEKNLYLQNKHKGNKTKTKSMKPKLLKTLKMNQFEIRPLISFIGTYDKKIRI